MAKRSFMTLGTSFPANALGSAGITNGYMAMVGSSTTAVADILEVLISGTASASTIGAFTLAPISTAATTPTALAAPNSDGPLQSNATPTAFANSYIAAATGPTISNSTSAGKINLGLNTFGGIIRWNAAPTQQYTLIGNAVFAAGPPVTSGQAILFNATAGTGATTTANAHIIYEPY
jgi:hypothetical protein